MSVASEPTKWQRAEARRRVRMEADPEYREKRLAQQKARLRKFRRDNPEKAKALRRASDKRRRARERDEMLSERKFAIRGMRRAQIKRRARDCGRAFTIDGMPLSVPVRCPLSGVPLDGCDHNRTPSIDRIDNSRGYEPGNVWIISRRANSIKRGSDVETAKHRHARRVLH
jgi:hypothetical protein